MTINNYLGGNHYNINSEKKSIVESIRSKLKSEIITSCIELELGIDSAAWDCINLLTIDLEERVNGDIDFDELLIELNNNNSKRQYSGITQRVDYINFSVNEFIDSYKKAIQIMYPAMRLTENCLKDSIGKIVSKSPYQGQKSFKKEVTWNDIFKD